MKILLINLLILSFLGISILGFVAMYHSNSHGDKLCVTKTVNGLDCPANPFAFADFHLNLFKEFSSADFGNFLNIYLALIALFLLGLVFIFFRPNSLSADKTKYYPFERFFEYQPSLFKSRNLYWFSLHENSPTSH